MRRVHLTILSAALLLLISSCGGDEASTENAPETEDKTHGDSSDDGRPGPQDPGSGDAPPADPREPDVEEEEPEPEPEPQMTVSPGRIFFVSDRDGNLELYRVNTHTRDLVRLTNTARDEEAPAVSSDGSTIAFSALVQTESSELELSQIFTMSVNGGSSSQLSSTLLGAQQPSWSPDGNEVAAVGGVLTPFQRIRVADGFAQNISGIDGTSVAWSSQNTLVYARNAGGDSDIFTTDDIDNAEPRITNVTAADGLENTSPAPSPDGQQIAFVTEMNEVGNRSQDLFVMNIDGTNLRRLTETRDASETHPTWSPDGMQIAYERRTLQADIYVIDAGGENDPINITPDTNASEETTPNWTIWPTP